MKKKYFINGMHCQSCEIKLEQVISGIDGVKRAEVSRRGIAEVEFFGEYADDEVVALAVKRSGYTMARASILPWISQDVKVWFELAIGLCALFFLWMLSQIFRWDNIFSENILDSPTYPVVFFIGLAAGVSTCMAVVGGLVAGFSANYAEHHINETSWQRFKPNLFFNGGRLISYGILGGVIGVLGSVIQFSSEIIGFFIVVSGIIMIYMGLKLTEISPRFSSFNIVFPKRIGRALGLRKNKTAYSHTEAFVGGAATFFLPCGFTQAMQLYAATTRSGLSGAIIMFLFALGTTPGLLGVGAASAMLKGKIAKVLFKFIGLIVFFLGLLSLISGARASGINIPAISIFGSSSDSVSAVIENGEQVAIMRQAVDGYYPNNFLLKKNIPVKWIIYSENLYTCASTIRLPAFGIVRSLVLGENVINFTPQETGVFQFTCDMGMYPGKFTVTD